MKHRNSLTRLTLLLAVLMTLGAARAQADDILPGVSFGFAPVGISMNRPAHPDATAAPNTLSAPGRWIEATTSRVLRFFEIARVFVRFDHVTSFIVNADYGIM